MKLQINQSGAWRNGVDLPARDCSGEPGGQVRDVMLGAAVLANAVGAKLRMVDDDGLVCWYFTPERQWHRPHEARS